MRRKLHLIVAVILLLGAVVGIVPEKALAYPPCGPFQQPLTNNGSFCRPAYMGGELMQLAPGIPFAWVRSNPASDAPVVTTLYPASYANLQIASGSTTRIDSWDGVQNWYLVHPYPLNKEVVGWVEQASLTYAAITGYPLEDPTIQADWAVPISGHVKPGIPFLWLRSAAGSDAGVLYTLPANAALTITGSPVFDGVQWWWMVDYATPRGVRHGYVEQALIVAR